MPRPPSGHAGESGPGGIWNDPSTGQPYSGDSSSSSGGGGGGATATVPAPAALAPPQPANAGIDPTTGQPYNFNDQSSRADYRANTGGYIDNSGVYAAGAGARIGDTWSGANASQNTAPDIHQLPVINGVPVSPSNGFTGENTGAIMYRGDPQYEQYFGPGTPGYSSRPTPWAPGGAWDGTDPNGYLRPAAAAAGQQSLADWNSAQAPAPATYKGPMQPGSSVPAPAALGSPSAGSEADTAAWQAGMAAPSDSGMGFGPYATQDAPELTVQGRYTENGQIIEKSTDQYGNPYYQTVGAAPANSPATTTTAPAAPAAPPAAPDPTAGGKLVPLVVGDKLEYVPKEVAAKKEADDADKKAQSDALAAANKQVEMFRRADLDRQFNLQQTIAAGTIAHNKAMEQQASAAQAQLAMHQAMQDDIAKQAQELAQKAAAQTAIFQQQQIETTRQGQAMTNSIEQDKLALQRQQQRGGRAGRGVRFA